MAVVWGERGRVGDATQSFHRFQFFAPSFISDVLLRLHFVWSQRRQLSQLWVAVGDRFPRWVIGTGPHGMVEELPAGWAMETVMVLGQGGEEFDLSGVLSPFSFVPKRHFVAHPVSHGHGKQHSERLAQQVKFMRKLTSPNV
jgi:hypothetical protein